MEGIADEVLADLALDEGLDCWELAIIWILACLSNGHSIK